MVVKISENVLKQLYCKEMLTDKQIAEKLNTTRNDINRMRKKYDIKTIKRKDRNPLTNFVLKQLYEEEKLTDKEIGSRFGYSAGYVTELRKKYGIATNRSFQMHRKLDLTKIYAEYIREGLYQKEIADRYNVSKDWLITKWKAMGLKIKTNHRHGVYKSLLTNQIILEILTGTLLGDAHLSKRKKSCRLEIKHAVSQQEWVAWKIKRLSAVFNFSVSHIINTSGFEGQPQVRGISKTHPELSDIYREWYDEAGIKYISWSTLLTITPLTLAVWIMDDGSLNKKSYTLYSQSFSKEENQVLCDYLNQQLGLHARCRKHREGETVIAFPIEDYNFISGQLEYYFGKHVPSMAYKWGKNSYPVLQM